MSDIDEAKQALDKLENTPEGSFTENQLKALADVISAWNSVKGFIAVMRYTGITVKWCAGFALLWAAFKEGLFGPLLTK
jgi:hypothetical protein